MPAKSEDQRQAAAIALSAKRGETDPSELYGAAKKMYKGMSEDELEDFASEVKESKKLIKRNLMRESINEANLSNQEVIEQLRDLQEEMLEKTEEIRNVLRSVPGITKERAESYWLAQIEQALGDEGYLGGAGVSMQDTIDELYSEELDDE